MKPYVTVKTAFVALRRNIMRAAVGKEVRIRNVAFKNASEQKHPVSALLSDGYIENGRIWPETGGDV